MRTQKPVAAALVAPPPTHDLSGGLEGAAHIGLVQTRTEHITALKVQVPRDLDALTKDVLKEAAFMGEEFFYAWEQKDKSSPTGRKLVKGLSIDGAMVLLRNWGNDACPCKIIDDTPTHWTFEATFIDYEKGFAIGRPFRQRKVEKHGNFDSERALDIAFQIGVSKAQRNAIDKGIPAWLTRDAMAAATDAANKVYTDVPASITRFRKYARKIGVTDLQLQIKIGKMVDETGEMLPRPWAEWTPAECVTLAAVFRAIQQQMTTVAEEFPPLDATPAADQPKPEAPQPAQTVQSDVVQQGTLQQSLLGDAQPPTNPEPATKKRRREPGDD